MSQHDFDLANQAGAAFRSDANNALQALATLSSAATAPATTYARMLWADTTSNQLKRRNAANSGWVVLCSLDEAFILSRSSNTIWGESDRGKTMVATAGFTQTIAAAATLADGWYIDVIVDTGATLVIDPNGAETIDGAATKSIAGPSQGRVVCNGTLFRTTFVAAPTAALPINYLSGLTLSNNITDPTNDIDIAAGSARDSTNAADITLGGGGLVKRLDAAWAVGINQGGLDTGAIANGTYHVWLIKRSDTGVVDVLFSVSATAPTMPSNYDYKRRIGSIIRASAAILAFTQDGDLFSLNTTVEDISATNPGSGTAVTRTMGSIPDGIRVRGIFMAAIRSVATGAVNIGLLSDLSANDETLANDGTTPGNFHYEQSVSGQATGAQVEVMTNTSRQIRSKILSSDANTVLRIRTRGWFDTRGK